MLEFLKDFFFGDVVHRNDYLFDTPHIVTLIAVVLLAIFITLFFKNKSKKQKDTLLWVFWSILLFFEITSRVINLIKGKDIITTILPFHFCSIMVWVMLFAVILKNKHMYNIAAMGGLVATSAFLLYPAVGFNVEILKFSQYYSVISHSLGFILSIFLLTQGYVDFSWKNIWAVGVFLFVVYVHSILCNFVFYTGENYMYYVENPLPFFDYNFYILFYICVVTLYFLSFFIIYNLKKSRRNKIWLFLQIIFDIVFCFQSI